MFVFQGAVAVASRTRHVDVQAEKAAIESTIQSNQPIQEAARAAGHNPAIDGPLTAEKAATLSRASPEFKQVLESELQKSGLLEQWQRFVVDFERRQAFEAAKTLSDAKQAIRTTSSVIKKDQEGQKYAGSLARDPLKSIKPRKVEPAEKNEFFNPKNAA